jgi:5-dehydro-2-deoxygluconokinase
LPGGLRLRRKPTIDRHPNGVNARDERADGDGRRIDAVVIGRVGADLYPLQLNTPLESVRTFERFVGGFAGNVATGLARLGVATAIVSAVGDDGHGRYVRAFLEDEGVDTGSLAIHPTLRTALAFCEAWPPDHFPVTFYRTPTCPDWEMRTADVPLELVARAPLVYVSGTGLAREPSRTATFAALEARVAAGEPSRAATIFDIDWRAELWTDPTDFPALARRAMALADTVIGGEAEFRATRVEPSDAIVAGARVAILKRGPDGAVVVARDSARHIRGLAVPVTNGLGAGDAFAAAYGAAVLTGLDPHEAALRANAAGAIVATRLSCSAAMPTAAELDALLQGGTVVDGVVRERVPG